MKNFVLFLCVSFSVIADDHGYKVSADACSEKMQALLYEHPESVVIHVKGLVCSSCAIGVRIGLSKINGVDLSKFNKGVMLDSSTQYVVLVINSKVDFSKVFEAIYDAGYDPIHLCYLENGKAIRINSIEV